jgi:hypothetical protein
VIKFIQNIQEITNILDTYHHLAAHIHQIAKTKLKKNGKNTGLPTPLGDPPPSRDPREPFIAPRTPVF